jgi:hypothetical protein
MISLKEFKKLRLRPFCLTDQLYSEEREEHGDYVVESVRGVWFFRPTQEDDDTCTISLDFRDNSTDCCDAILAALGLSLRREDTPEEVDQKLGAQPVFVEEVAAASSTNRYYCVGDFVICCSFLLPHPKGSFWNVEVTNPEVRDSLADAKRA